MSINRYGRLMIIFLLVIFDYYFTWLGINFGYISELNPLLMGLFNKSFLVGLIIKSVITIIPLFLIYTFRSVNYKLYLGGTKTIIIVYTLINIIHTSYIFYFIGGILQWYGG